MKTYLTKLFFITILGITIAACSESAEEKIAREVKAECEALGEKMATPAEKADKEKYQKGLNECIEYMTRQRMNQPK